jgi:hypothetical protein
VTSHASRPTRPDPGAIVPRSASLALWLWATVRPDDAPAAVRTVVDDDEPHRLVEVPPDGLPAATLDELFTLWAGRVRSAAAIFPGPGDALGAPAPISPIAIDAEECVLVTVAAGPQAPGAGVVPPGPDAPEVLEHWALVPEVERFGSVLEPGHLVTWTVARIDRWERRTLGVVGTLDDAQRQLRLGLREATEALMELDVSRWREDAAGVIASLREPVDLRSVLPRDVDARRAEVFQSAARLRAIVDLATADDGGAVNLWQADQRSTALREVDRAARRAMSAATLHVTDEA